MTEIIKIIQPKRTLINWSLIAALAISTITPLIIAQPAYAVPFTKAFLRYDRLKATTATGGRVCAQVSNSTPVEGKVLVTFPTTGGTDYVVNAVAANWTVTTTGLDSGQTAWPGIGTATAVSGKTVTFPSSDLTTGLLYCFNFSGTSTLTTSSAGAVETVQGTIATQTAAAAAIDSTTYDQNIITDDQVVVSAIVPPSMTFVLSGNTDSFASNLSTSSTITTAGRTITLTTNAASGWIVWAKGTNPSSGAAGKGALKSATAANYTIPTTNANALGSASHTLTNGTEDYGLALTTITDAANGGVVTADAAYDSTVGTKIGVLDTSQFRPIASANGTANGDILTVAERATIAGQTPAANDYTDTITFIGAGQF